MELYKDEYDIVQIKSDFPDEASDLLRSMKSRNAEEVVAAIDVFAKVPMIAICDMVAKRLGHPDDLVRGSACDVLAFWNQQHYAKDILPLLDDTDVWVRHMAVMALGDLMATQYRSELKRLLDDWPEDEKAVPAYALVNFGDEEYFDLFLSGLDFEYTAILGFILNNIITIVPPDRINDSMKKIRQFARTTEDEPTKVKAASALEELKKLRRKLARKKASQTRKT